MCGKPLICHVAARGSSNQLDLIIRAGADVNPGGNMSTKANMNPGADVNLGGDVNTGGDVNPGTDVNTGADVNPGGDVNTGADVNPGTDINTVMENDTPLNSAVYNERCQEHKCVPILLKAGARINVRTRRYPNALTRYLYQWWPALSCQLAFNEKMGHIMVTSVFFYLLLVKQSAHKLLTQSTSWSSIAHFLIFYCKEKTV